MLCSPRYAQSRLPINMPTVPIRAACYRSADARPQLWTHLCPCCCPARRLGGAVQHPWVRRAQSAGRRHGSCPGQHTSPPASPLSPYPEDRRLGGPCQQQHTGIQNLQTTPCALSADCAQTPADAASRKLGRHHDQRRVPIQAGQDKGFSSKLFPQMGKNRYTLPVACAACTDPRFPL